ncbi:MAG: aminotransferase DegT [Gammaproteobacteria bacterium]|nr:aminotransferase DegT [Gammaproteobacteria bacterium]
MNKITSIDSNAILKDALNLMNEDGYGVCYVFQKNVLVGIMTDGDIRRGLVKGILLDDKVKKIMNKNFFSLPLGTSVNKIQTSLEKYKFIPIIDEKGNIVSTVNNKTYHNIPLVQPLFNGNEKKYLTECIETGWISSQGSFVTKFEKIFSKYSSCPNTLAVSNGTSALHLSICALGIGEGDEVIIPDFTFAAVINAVIYSGAKPVIIDVNKRDMTIDSALIEKNITKKTKAIIAVHLYGYSANMEKILKIAKKHGLYVIEDCAEALGTFYKDKHVGIVGDAATFSFFGNKTISTGEGGMLQFKRKKHLNFAKKLRDHGMSQNKRYWHEEVGFNYRLTNLQSAVGVAQMEKIDFFVKRKREIAKKYDSYLSTFDKLILPKDGKNIKNSFWLYTVLLDESISMYRDKIISILTKSDIEVRPTFNPLHLMPPYIKYKPKYSLTNSISFSERGISLPTSINMTNEEIQFVCDRLVIAIHRCID